MQEQAELLSQAVSIFKLSHDDVRRPAAAPAPRRAPVVVAAAPAAAAPAIAAPRPKPAAPKKAPAPAASGGDEWEEF
jgi:methyl-accepting chemotaxis protein